MPTGCDGLAVIEAGPGLVGGLIWSSSPDTGELSGVPPQISLKLHFPSTAFENASANLSACGSGLTAAQSMR